ncbi:MAG: LysR family transcriptional regulator [Spongiibacter sp.]
MFCLCAESESFSAAAHRAGLSPSAVSRAIARMEKRLGVKLFGRTTRRMKLTEAGRRYHQQCQQAIAQIVEAEREITGQQQQPSGVVSISLPTPFAHFAVLPRLAEFRALHPAISLHIHMSNRNVDFIADGIDLAIRMRPPVDSELVARPLLTSRMLVVASPEYLQRAGEPQSLEDLRNHDCVQFVPPSSGVPSTWSFVENGSHRDIAVSGRVRVSDDPLACVALARHHCGLLQAHSFTVENELREGTLCEVLQSYAGSRRHISLLYRKSPYTPLRQRVLIDFLVEAFRQ